MSFLLIASVALAVWLLIAAVILLIGFRRLNAWRAALLWPLITLLWLLVRLGVLKVA